MGCPPVDWLEPLDDARPAWPSDCRYRWTGANSSGSVDLFEALVDLLPVVVRQAATSEMGVLAAGPFSTATHGDVAEADRPPPALATVVPNLGEPFHVLGVISRAKEVAKPFSLRDSPLIDRVQVGNVPGGRILFLLLPSRWWLRVLLFVFLGLLSSTPSNAPVLVE